MANLNANPGLYRRGGVGLVLILQTLVAGSLLSWGLYRFEVIQSEKKPPEPLTQPRQIGPRYDRPAVVDDQQLFRILTKLRPRLRGLKPQINHVDHALRFWGVEAQFKDFDVASGEELRRLLLDHRTFTAAWGTKAKPFLLPQTIDDTEFLAFRTKSGVASASHVDHTLAALAECGTPLDYPVLTPTGELPLRSAFDQAFREFSLNQVEYEWSTLVFLHYLPHVPSWFTSEGQRVTWDLLAERLMRERLAQGVCYGQHRLHALTLMLQVDEEFAWLSSDCRRKILAHLRGVTDRLVKSQHADGYWDGRWPGVEWDGDQSTNVVGPLGPLADQLLATGHALEWWAFAPTEVLPPDDRLIRASQWLVKSIDGLSEADVQRYYTFLSHAGRSLALWRSRRPAAIVATSQ